MLMNKEVKNSDKEVKNSGFTLLEVVISLGILTVGIVALMTLATTNMKANENAKRLSQALNIATEQMETLKAVSFPNLQTDNVDVAAVGFGGVLKDCGNAVGTPPVFRCNPVDSNNVVQTTTADGLEFTWYYSVTYVDMDNDNVYYRTAPQIDSGDIKLISVIVEWTGIFGYKTTSLKALRSKI